MSVRDHAGHAWLCVRCPGWALMLRGLYMIRPELQMLAVGGHGMPASTPIGICQVQAVSEEPVSALGWSPGTMHVAWESHQSIHSIPRQPQPTPCTHPSEAGGTITMSPWVSASCAKVASGPGPGMKNRIISPGTCADAKIHDCRCAVRRCLASGSEKMPVGL